MTLLPQLIFAGILVIFGVFIFKRVNFIRSNIALGQSNNITGDRAKRWKNVLLIAFGQKKMFKKPIPALLHLLIYVGFILINIEVLEIILDGLLGAHRMFAPFFGTYYGALISFFELLALGVMFSCVLFF